MDQYRVYGNPIKQSRSPFIHQEFAVQTNQQLSYQSQLVALDQFEQVIQDFISEGGRGANVTVPFKEKAMALCDQLSERAKLAGAVNTLIFEQGKIIGDNTDGLGLVQDLINHNVEINNSRILLLGAGGAAKGVILPLLERKPHQLVIANRTMSKAESLVEQFSDPRVTSTSFSETKNFHFDIINNATSAGLSGDKLPVPNSVIHCGCICYDMVYGKTDTPFMVEAKKLGAAKVIDGLGMLVGQAAESFYLWRKVKPKTSQILNELRKLLSE